ncbi:circadian locomoter output cycles protein kaput-like [Pomacea canaliculata]|uniref:circadian locomoter output cycles protein kaput-like n=1 Tax=Pomacea canaliculata TaxID=400727 RepID=UPI000D73B551|nr:circadian locomoter output cycles protein kaput-like [Pomacea canaliculata]
MPMILIFYENVGSTASTSGHYTSAVITEKIDNRQYHHRNQLKHPQDHHHNQLKHHQDHHHNQLKHHQVHQLDDHRKNDHHAKTEKISSNVIHYSLCHCWCHCICGVPVVHKSSRGRMGLRGSKKDRATDRLIRMDRANYSNNRILRRSS